MLVTDSKVLHCHRQCSWPTLTFVTLSQPVLVTDSNVLPCHRQCSWLTVTSVTVSLIAIMTDSNYLVTGSTRNQPTITTLTFSQAALMTDINVCYLVTASAGDWHIILIGFQNLFFYCNSFNKYFFVTRDVPVYALVGEIKCVHSFFH